MIAVYKATGCTGESAHFGVESTARAWARSGGKVERIELPEPPNLISVVKTNTAGWAVDRRKPYTNIGVRRLACIRCGDRAQFQWQICSDGNRYRPLCLDCDVALNRLVLVWMGHPEAEKLAGQYEISKRATTKEPTQ